MELNITMKWDDSSDEHSNLVKHAVYELDRLSLFTTDPKFAHALVLAVRGFTSYGHSGGSAQAAKEMLTKLLGFKPLSPLTDDPEEWRNVSCFTGEPMWQNKRDSTVFSKDGGKTWGNVTP